MYESMHSAIRIKMMNDDIQRYEQMEAKIVQLTGHDMERLLDLLAKGYTLQPPTYPDSIAEVERS